MYSTAACVLRKLDRASLGGVAVEIHSARSILPRAGNQTSEATAAGADFEGVGAGVIETEHSYLPFDGETLAYHVSKSNWILAHNKQENTPLKHQCFQRAE
jgi:hypothetical protein